MVRKRWGGGERLEGEEPDLQRVDRETGMLSFTTNLEDPASDYRQHHQLVAHWHSVLPPAAPLCVPNEELIADLETRTRRILDLIASPWDRRCLEFYKTDRPVARARGTEIAAPAPLAAIAGP